MSRLRSAQESVQARRVDWLDEILVHDRNVAGGSDDK